MPGLIGTETEIGEHISRAPPKFRDHAGLLEPLPLPQDLSQTASSQLEVHQASLSRAFLERMEHEYGLLKLRDVEHPIRRSPSESNFTDAGPDGGHRLPVVRGEPDLDPSQLEASRLPGGIWKPSEIGKRRTDPNNGLVAIGDNIHLFI